MGEKKKGGNLSVFHLARWHLMSEVSQDWQMYILVVVLSCLVTLKEHTHTHMHGHYPLDFIFQFFFPGGGGGGGGVPMSFSVIPLNANTHKLRHLLD